MAAPARYSLCGLPCEGSGPSEWRCLLHDTQGLSAPILPPKSMEIHPNPSKSTGFPQVCVALDLELSLLDGLGQRLAVCRVAGGLVAPPQDAPKDRWLLLLASGDWALAVLHRCGQRLALARLAPLCPAEDPPTTARVLSEAYVCWQSPDGSWLLDWQARELQHLPCPWCPVAASSQLLLLQRERELLRPGGRRIWAARRGSWSPIEVPSSVSPLVRRLWGSRRCRKAGNRARRSPSPPCPRCP